MTLRHLTAFALALVVAACAPECTPQPVPPLPDATGGTGGMGTGGTGGATTDDCAAAGEVLYLLQCRSAAGDPLWVGPDGRTFAQACRDEAAQGVAWRADCIRRVTDCAQVDSAAQGFFCVDGGAP